jgi:hypothetical protein
MRLWLLLALLSNFLIAAVDSTAASFDLNYWKKILQYNASESRVDGEKFFLSPNGKTDPLAELAATIEAFKNPDYKAGWFNYHPQCVFRERYRFLKSEGLLDGVKVEACPEFEEWKKGLNADSVTLIFSSSYPNNPSSLFGHTLLRLNQKNKTNDLLDYAVAFSAVPEKEDIGVVFAFKGIFGGYKGLFEVTKYYTKVNEYSNGESRDLIEYNLNMTEAELERLINHLWELYQSTYLDYFFADENCSAVLADLLAVAYKDDENVNAHARWYYLPGEMIKHFSETPGRIKSVKYRASLKKQLKKSWEKLSAKELGVVKEVIRTKSLPEDLKNHVVLDNIIGLLNFTEYRTKQKLVGDTAILLRKSLIARAKLDQASLSEEVYDQSNRAEYAHRPQKFSLFLKTVNNNLQSGLEIKQGFHDLMARDLGFDSFSQFDFGVASFIYEFKKKKFDYDTITVVNLVSLHDYQYYDPQLSWRAKLYSDPIYDFDCSLCHKHNLEALGGVSFKPRDRTVASFMAGAFSEISTHLKKGFRAGPILEASFYAQLGNHYKVGLVNELRFDATKRVKKDYYNKIGLRQSGFFNAKNDYRLESFVISRFGDFTKNTIIHQVSYGHYF